MKRSHILARELRGVLLVLLVAVMIVWLFSRLDNERAAAQVERAASQTTTSVVETTTTSIEVVVDDNERLCSLAEKFRGDLRNVKVRLVNLAGDPITQGDLPIDIGLHPDGDVPVEVREERTVAGEEAFTQGAAFTTTTEPLETTTTTIPPPVAIQPPRIIDIDRIDPLESGLLGEPQTIALNFYTAASALRLGTITADFAATADYFADFVEIGEPARWDLEELAESDFNDQWTALSTRPVFGIDATLEFIEEECSVRIGNGFVYRVEAEEIETFEPTEVFTPIDPDAVPSR